MSDDPLLHPPAPVNDSAVPEAGRLSRTGFTLPLAPQAGTPAITVTHPELFVAKAEKLIYETRKQDILDGTTLPRERIRQDPIVCLGQWAEVWRQVLDPAEVRLGQHVLIIVAPRSYGSTTLALHLLARYTDHDTDIVKLDADWKSPMVSRLPAEERRAYQLDLKDPDHDRASADFLRNLEQYAGLLERLGSYLVLNVARDLWADHHVPARAGIQVVHLHEPPPAQNVVEAHLKAREAPGLIPYVRGIDTTKVSLSGLDAVEAVRAADSVIMAWREHERLSNVSLAMKESSETALDTGLAARVTSALSDWRDKLDVLFGEAATVHHGKDTSLPLEDRCLLLALAVRQSAPMPEVARSARGLQQIINTGDKDANGFTASAGSVFAGRGLRRRILDAGAAVDGHDSVLFDQPGYGRAVLTYVWDNYEAMRDPLLQWLMSGNGSGEGAARTVDAIAALTLRHGTAEHLTRLSLLARSAGKELLSAVMLRAVQDEHAGRRAWGILYGWASAQEHASTVVGTCLRMLDTPDVTSSQARMAMVRLRRVANASRESIQSEVLAAFERQAHTSAGVDRLVTEVRAWQSGRPRGAGAAAFLALMTVPGGITPWLLSDGAPSEVDVTRALQDLLGHTETAHITIDRLTGWIRQSAAEPDCYARVRDRLLPALRDQKIFKASFSLMHALSDVTVDGRTDAAEDFWGRLVDNRVRGAFPLSRTSA
ncbi:hypothetical protein [Streptomyces lavendulae]|uniref:hypothetical protein n=1 Tax=Streptomyces lavendulae TaxID=1914 RepID=UPI0036F01A8C